MGIFILTLRQGLRWLRDALRNADVRFRDAREAPVTIKQFLKEIAMSSLFMLAGVGSYFYIQTGVFVLWVIATGFNLGGYLVYKSLVKDANGDKDEQAEV